MSLIGQGGVVLGVCGAHSCGHSVRSGPGDLLQCSPHCSRAGGHRHQKDIASKWHHRHRHGHITFYNELYLFYHRVYNVLNTLLFIKHYL